MNILMILKSIKGNRQIVPKFYSLYHCDKNRLILIAVFGDFKNPLAYWEESRLLFETKVKDIMKIHGPGCNSGIKVTCWVTELQVLYTSVLTCTFIRKRLIGNWGNWTSFYFLVCNGKVGVYTWYSVTYWINFHRAERFSKPLKVTVFEFSDINSVYVKFTSITG